MKTLFRYESDMIKDLEPIIITSCVDCGLGIPQVTHEPPINFFSNDNADMMLLFRETKKLLFIEYKLNDYNKLAEQVQKLNYAIGIINKKPSGSYQKIIQYGKDDHQIELIDRLLSNPDLYQDIAYNQYGAVYWYGYLNGDIYNGKRLTFHHLYREAIKNVLGLYPIMAFDDIYFLLRCGYNIKTAKQHYNYVKVRL